MKFDFFNKLEMTYIANSGVMLSCGNNKIIIDGIHTADVAPFCKVPSAITDSIAVGKTPFSGVKLFLFTHHLPDHFDASEANRMLSINRKAQMIMPRACAERMRTADNYNPKLESRIRQMEISSFRPVEMMVRDIFLEVFALSYDGDENDDTENYAYMFEMKNKTIFITGDALPDEESFEISHIFDKHIDFLLVPFTFIGLAEGRKIVKRISPQKLFITHLPDPQLDNDGWGTKAMKMFKKYADDMPETQFLNNPMSVYKL